MCICEKFPDGSGISHSRPNESFVGEAKYNIINVLKAFFFNRFYAQSPCNCLIEDYTKIIYTISESEVTLQLSRVYSRAVQAYSVRRSM
jgi:hypothetical protein